MVFQYIIQGFAATDCAAKTFFGLPVWYKYLEVKTEVLKSSGKTYCRVVIGRDPQKLLLIGLGIIDILLRLIAMVAIGFVVYGGVKYIISRGEPDKINNARSTIINALIGLAIAAVSAGVVSFVGRSLTN